MSSDILYSPLSNNISFSHNSHMSTEQNQFCIEENPNFVSYKADHEFTFIRDMLFDKGIMLKRCVCGDLVIILSTQFKL
jgi:hypothetical protein